MAKAKDKKPPSKSPQGAPWEAQLAGCRGLRIGSHIWVTGATARRADGRVFGRGKPDAQAERCLDLVEKLLARLGAGMADVVRARVFLRDIAHAPEVERILHARFAERPPASSIVQVGALRHPGMLVELEAEAFVADAAA